MTYNLPLTTYYLIYNGELMQADKALFTAGNRAFRYGDGIFETMKAVKGEIVMAGLHFERLFGAMELLQIKRPAYFTAAYLESLVSTLCTKNELHELARVRLTVYRAGGGLYRPEEYTPHFVIQAEPLPEEMLLLNQEGWSIGIFPDAKKATDAFSHLKSNNCLPYVMAAIFAKQNRLNEAVICNHYGRVADSTAANVYIIKAGNIYTPPLSEGCVAGTVRKFLLSHPAFNIQEKPLSANDLLEADELFLTNAIYGLRWVERLQDKRYTGRIAAELHQSIKSA